MSLTHFLGYLIGFGFLAMGFEYKDYTLTTISGIIFFILGVNTIINPLPDISTLANLLIGHSTWAVGAYILIRSSIELYKEYLP